MSSSMSFVYQKFFIAYALMFWIIYIVHFATAVVHVTHFFCLVLSPFFSLSPHPYSIYWQLVVATRRLLEINNKTGCFSARKSTTKKCVALRVIRMSHISEIVSFSLCCFTSFHPSIPKNAQNTHIGIKNKRRNGWIDTTSHTILLKATQNAIQLLLLCYVFMCVCVYVETHISHFSFLWICNNNKQLQWQTQKMSMFV